MVVSESITNISGENSDLHENENDDVVVNNDIIVLQETDIPGATLLKPVEQCNMAILKRWLLCRGAKISGKKNELVQRVKDYVDNGLAPVLVDPDGGVNIARKRLKLGLLTDVITADEKFPSSGFTEDLSILPQFFHNFLWKFMIEDVELKKQLSTEKPLVKGYNMFKSGHVLQIYAQQQEQKFFVLSKVLPSMKKGKVYNAKIVLSSNGIVLRASCGCPAGVDGRCNHVTASLFALDSYSKTKQGVETGNQELPCTSKPCKWNVPRQKKIEPSPVRNMEFVKHEWGKDKSPKPAKNNTDVRAPHERKLPNEKLNEVLEMVKKVQQRTGKLIGLSLILPQSIPNSVEGESSQPTSQTAVPDHQRLPPSWNLTSPNNPGHGGPLSLEEIKEKGERAKKRLFGSSAHQKEIEEKTKNQHQSLLWHTIRQPRITASKAKRCLVKDTTSPTKAVATILQYNANVQTKAMKEGVEWESRIVEKYEQTSGNHVSKSGFVISTKHPFLGASPDGLIHNGNGVIEIKKVTSKETESFEETLCRLNIYKKRDGKLIINHNHQYFVQIQQQMYCTDTFYCHFIIFNGVWMHVDVIIFDSVFWSNVLVKLEKFYFTHVFPEIVYPRIRYGCIRWEKDLAFPVLSSN